MAVLTLCLWVAALAYVYSALSTTELSEPLRELSDAPLCSSEDDVRAALMVYVPEGTPYASALASLETIGFTLDARSDENQAAFTRWEECFISTDDPIHQIQWTLAVQLVNGRTGSWEADYTATLFF